LCLSGGKNEDESSKRDLPEIHVLPGMLLVKVGITHL